jgi:hypothetical protein
LRDETRKTPFICTAYKYAKIFVKYALVNNALDKIGNTCHLVVITTMIAEVYDALREAGTSDEKARKASEVLAARDTRFSRIETELAVVKWMTGTVLALTVAIAVKLYVN